MNEPEKKAIPTATINLYVNFNLDTVSIRDVRIRYRVSEAAKKVLLLVAGPPRGVGGG